MRTAIIALMLGQVLPIIPIEKAPEPRKLEPIIGVSVIGKSMAPLLRTYVDSTLSRYDWGITTFKVMTTGNQGGTAIVKVKGIEFQVAFLLTTEKNRPMELLPIVYQQGLNLHMLKKYGKLLTAVRCEDISMSIKDDTIEWRGCQAVRTGGKTSGMPTDHFCLTVTQDKAGKVLNVVEAKR